MVPPSSRWLPQATHILALLDGDTADAGNRLHAQLLHCLPALLLGAGLLSAAARTTLIALIALTPLCMAAAMKGQKLEAELLAAPAGGISLPPRPCEGQGLARRRSSDRLPCYPCSKSAIAAGDKF